MPLLSIVIVNWNTKDILYHCLLAVRQNVRDISAEIFVVDNGSTDGSQEMVKNNFPEIILIENKKNLGFARANNIAIKKACGDFILLVNSDTILKKGAVEGILDLMNKDQDIGITGLQLLNLDGSAQNSISTFPSYLTELTNKSFLRLLAPKRFCKKTLNSDEPLEVDSIIGAFMMVRRSAVDNVGILDEDYFFFLEETDWCLRMKKAGWKVMYDPRYSVYHVQGQSAAQVATRARIEYWKSRYIYFSKHFGKRSLTALKFGLLFRLLFAILGTGFINMLTLGRISKLRNRLFQYLTILNWHIRGCPESWTLKYFCNNEWRPQDGQ